MVTIPYKIEDESLMPFYSNKYDAGMDIMAKEDVTIRRGETVIIKTGLRVSLPEGFELQIRPRSGLSYNTPLIIVNSPGTIDCGYQDEIGVIIKNTSSYGVKTFDITSKGNQHGTYKIKKGDRIAQMVLNRVYYAVFVDEPFLNYNRGGGFGSTGTAKKINE